MPYGYGLAAMVGSPRIAKKQCSVRQFAASDGLTKRKMFAIPEYMYELTRQSLLKWFCQAKKDFFYEFYEKNGFLIIFVETTVVELL